MPVVLLKVFVLLFSNERWPLARSASPPLPASVSARPASGLAPVVGRKDTNGLTVRSDCCALRDANGTRAAAARTRVDRYTWSSDGVWPPVMHDRCHV